MNNKKNTKYLKGLLSVLATLLLWEFLSKAGLLGASFFSAPSEILMAGKTLLAKGDIWYHIYNSLMELCLGFFLAVFLGIVSGLIIGSKSTLYEYFKFHIAALTVFPMVAIIPLIIIWFGVGSLLKIAVVFLMTVGPVIRSSIDGVKNTDKDLFKMAKTFGASDLLILKEIYFFSALPMIFSGLRIATGRAIAGLVVSESIGYGTGLGYLVTYYGSMFETSKLLFVALLILSVAFSLEYLIGILEKKVVRW